MTLSEVQTMLEGTGLPVAYNSFTEDEIKQNNIKLPFICWLNISDNNFGADNKVYHTAHHVQIELYEEYRDAVNEGKVETALADRFFTKNETYIDDQKMYEIIYEIEV